MKIEGKRKNPINIRLGKNNNNIIIEDESKYEEIPLIPGAMINGEHYGFILITEHNGKQKETNYLTQCKIQAIGMENGILNIFEEGKRLPWSFDKNGNLKYSIVDDFTDDFKHKMNEEIEIAVTSEEPKLIQPISIRIASNPEESAILPDDVIKEEYPLHPGAVFGDVHFGFILITEHNGVQKEMAYPTQNSIYAAAIEGSPDNDLKIYENGKYHPWVFKNNGELKEESSYNPYSRNDQQFIREHYGLNESDSLDFDAPKRH